MKMIEQSKNTETRERYFQSSVAAATPLWISYFVAAHRDCPRCMICSRAKPLVEGTPLSGGDYRYMKCRLCNQLQYSGVQTYWHNDVDHRLHHILTEAAREVSDTAVSMAVLLSILHTLNDGPWYYGRLMPATIVTHRYRGIPPVHPIIYTDGTYFQKLASRAGVEVTNCHGTIDENFDRWVHARPYS